MHTVLGSTAGRAAVSLTLAVGAAVALTAPALAAGHPPAAQHQPASARAAHASEVRIGTAVAYVRNPDGTIRRIR